MYCVIGQSVDRQSIDRWSVDRRLGFM